VRQRRHGGDGVENASEPDFETSLSRRAQVARPGLPGEPTPVIDAILVYFLVKK